MTEELKPCPFCGSHDVQLVAEYGDVLGRQYAWGVRCDKCNADFFIDLDSSDDGREETIDAWNRREGDAS